MKLTTIAFAAAAMVLAPQAHALINLELDQNTMSVVAPGTGSLTVTFTGSVDLTGGWTNSTSTLYFASNGSDTLSEAFDPAYLTWISGAQTTNYSGALFEVTVLPTSSGDYYLGGGSSGIAELDATGVDPTGGHSFTDTEQYEVIVTPAPEPATVLALGGLGALLLRRRRR